MTKLLNRLDLMRRKEVKIQLHFNLNDVNFAVALSLTMVSRDKALLLGAS